MEQPRRALSMVVLSALAGRPAAWVVILILSLIVAGVLVALYIAEHKI